MKHPDEATPDEGPRTANVVHGVVFVFTGSRFARVIAKINSAPAPAPNPARLAFRDEAS